MDASTSRSVSFPPAPSSLPSAFLFFSFSRSRYTNSEMRMQEWATTTPAPMQAHLGITPAPLSPCHALPGAAECNPKPPTHNYPNNYPVLWGSLPGASTTTPTTTLYCWGESGAAGCNPKRLPREQHPRPQVERNYEKRDHNIVAPTQSSATREALLARRPRDAELRATLSTRARPALEGALDPKA